MLFEFDSSIINIDPNNINQTNGIETLLSTYRKQNHVVFMRLADVPIISKKIGTSLSAGSRAALTTLYNNLPEYKVISEKFKRKIIVYIEDENKKGIFKKNESWYIPLKNFSSANIVEAALIGEDPSDAEILLEFARHYGETEKLRSFITKARLLNGGGANTSKTLTTYLKSEHSPCLCVTDSDKYHPKFRESSTTKKCREIVTQHPNQVVEHFSLIEREMENLVPKELIKKVARKDDFFELIESEILSNDEHWKYLDIKSGVSFKWIKKQDDPTNKYWKKSTKYFERRIKACPTCKSTGILDDENECTCSFIPGLGNNILSNVISHMHRQKPSLNLRDMQVDIRWKDVAQTVFEYTVAPKAGEKAH